MTTHHDSQACGAAAGCKECLLREQQRRLLELAAQTPPPSPRARTKALALLAAQASLALGGQALTALLVACTLLVGCVAPEAIEQARTEAAIARGHATDPALPIEARQIGADGERAWRVQHRALTGDDVPGAEAWPALPPELAVATEGGR